MRKDTIVIDEKNTVAAGSPHGVPFLTGRDTAPAYWAFGVLWVVLADSEQTGGAFSVMEQWMPSDGGPPPHVHPIDEWFNILEGSIEFRVEDKPPMRATAGDSVWIPRGTVHSFTTQSAAHVFNGYTPAGFEQVIMGLGTPAERRELPPADLGFEPHAAAQLMDNFWSASAETGWAKKWTQ
ncbi:cupin domain-containing protein [Amycolatopsis mediterranei]|uniref:cupin domain-containing protein n=1 Tax=Amycolatopsis mediterranei TaxID=33910 RepID=UPI000A620624|nr:cupin domain-containing protein [Amycolatopsis mediterranei]UZF76215.1 cupin domain-containing protein [Amycolatopsis mediterranei]